jgi:tetratricopeptide (TPR) repeat protein
MDKGAPSLKTLPMVNIGPEPDGIEDSGAVAGGDVNLSGGYVAGRDMTVVHQTREPVRAARHALPRDIAEFTGRRVEIGRIEDVLAATQAPPPVVVISNGPGSGKTALAVHVAHRLRSRFPQAQLHVRLGGREQPELRPDDALRRLLTQLGVAAEVIPQDLEDRLALYRSTMPEGSLVVLDNAMSAVQVEPLLPTGVGCAAIITSRYVLAELEGTHLMDLGRLPADEAYALLERTLGTDRTATDPQAVHDIVALCGALPLALRVVGSLLVTPARRRMPLAVFAAELGDEKARLDLLKVGEREVRASFALSYAALSPRAARLFRLLGTLRIPDVSDELAAAVDGTGLAAQALGELLDAHLIEPVSDTRVRFHDLMRLFARERALSEETAGDRAAALDRATAWCLQRAADWDGSIRHADAPAASSDAYTAALDGFERERAVFLAIIQQAADPDTEVGRDEVAWRLTAHLADFFDVRGYWVDWLAAAETAVAAATRQGESAGFGISLHNLSRILRLMRRTPEALEAATQALGLLDRTEQEVTRADVLSHLGILYREEHRYDEAVTSLDEAAGLYRDRGDTHGEGLVLRTLGHVLNKRRQLDDAEETLERAVLLLHEAGDLANAGWAHNNLISVHGARWHETAALAHFAQARDIFADIGHRQGEAWAYNHVGRVHRQYGRTTEQIDCHERALESFRMLGDRYGTGWALLDLAIARSDVAVLQEALEIFEEIGEHDGRGWALTWLAQMEGDPVLIDRALGHFRVIGNLQGEGTALSVRGDLERTAGRTEKAESAYQEALAPLRHSADTYREALTLWGLSDLDRLAGRANRARERTQQVQTMLDRIGAPQPPHIDPDQPSVRHDMDEEGQ